MMNRRSFLKISGLTAAALGTGYSTGRLLDADGNKCFSLHGFLPDDAATLREAIARFTSALPASALDAQPVIMADAAHAAIVSQAMGSRHTGRGQSGSGVLQIQINRLSHSVRGDIVVGNERRAILAPETDYIPAFAQLREKVRGRDAALMLSASFHERSVLSGLFGRSHAVIENERGEYDRIALDGRRTVIEVPGPVGRTGRSIEHGRAHVHSSTCRHSLCRNAGFASREGDVIACAPNRVLVSIVQA